MRKSPMGRVSQERPRPPRIGLISFSAIPDDPRVRRQGDLFYSRGWDVVAIGLPQARSRAPEWPSLAIDGGTNDEVQEPVATDLATDRATSSPGLDQWLASLRQRVRTTVGTVHERGFKRAQRLANRATDIVRLYLDPTRAEAAYWRMSPRFERIYELASRHEADIWLANDWTALPIAQRLAAEQHVPYAYDTHELAVDEYAQRLLWRLTQRPVIAEVERAGVAGAAVTSCVSQGISGRLRELYRLSEDPLLIRNMPHYEQHPYRPSGETIEVLYHGVVNIGRGLEACIDSVPYWRPEFRLTIRGPGPAAYLNALADRIGAAGLGERIELAPPVPMIDLVKEAARFDIGLFALPGHSQQNIHVLPNKFFEYTMAGLALCVSDLPEMTALLKQYELGHLIREAAPEAIATAINRFDRATIDACKLRALQAAKALNWETEAGRLFTAIERSIRSEAVVAPPLLEPSPPGLA